MNYLSYPVSTIVTIRFEEYQDFPAVTICNLNNLRKTPYMKSRVMQKLHKQQEERRKQQNRPDSSKRPRRRAQSGATSADTVWTNSRAGITVSPAFFSRGATWSTWSSSNLGNRWSSGWSMPRSNSTQPNFNWVTWRVSNTTNPGFSFWTWSMNITTPKSNWWYWSTLNSSTPSTNWWSPPESSTTMTDPDSTTAPATPPTSFSPPTATFSSAIPPTSSSQPKAPFSSTTPPTSSFRPWAFPLPTLPPSSSSPPTVSSSSTMPPTSPSTSTVSSTSTTMSSNSPTSAFPRHDSTEEDHDYFWNDYSFEPVDSNVLEDEEQSKANIRNFMDSLRTPRRLKYGHYLAKMLIDCTYQRTIKCSRVNFTRFYNHYFGNCYTFNKKPGTAKSGVSKAGPLDGLTLLLNVQSEEYMKETDTVGFKVLVHPQDSMPFPEDEGVVVSPGFATSIAIQKLHLKRTPPPYSDCHIYSEKENRKLNMYAMPPYKVGYSDKACQRTCYQKRVVKKCNCYDADYPRPERSLAIAAGNISICGAGNGGDCLQAIHKKLEKGELDCGNECLSSCEEITFTHEMSMGVWPSEASLGELKKLFQVMPKTFVNYTDVSFFRKNIAKINIYFKQLNYEKIETVPAYDWYRLLSDLGGQLGLWLGVSLLTAVEFLELGCAVLSHVFRNLHRTGNNLGRALMNNEKARSTPV